MAARGTSTDMAIHDPNKKCCRKQHVQAGLDAQSPSPPPPPRTPGQLAIDHNDGLSSAIGLVDNPICEVADYEVRAIGEEVVEPAVHLNELPESRGKNIQLMVRRGKVLGENSTQRWAR